MGRTRKSLDRVRDGGPNSAWVVRFFHPVRKKVVRLSLGKLAGAADTALKWLNEIFDHPENWHSPPETIPVDIRQLWAGTRALETPKSVDEEALVIAMGEADYWRTEFEKLEEKHKRLVKIYEHERGRKLRDGPCPTLQTALVTWTKEFKEGTRRDPDHVKNVGYDLARFVQKFGPAVEVDELSGREKKISAWIRSLDAGPGRQSQIRKHVLRFLEDSGVIIDRKAVESPGKKVVRAARGAIRALDRPQAESVANALETPWNDYFRVQAAMGFRPDELITLKQADFNSDLSEVTLSPLDTLTLKQGSRALRVPAEIRDIFKRRLESNPVVFPDPATGRPWLDAKRYNLRYNAALKKAGKAAGVLFKMDCRIGRRTCATSLLNAGVSMELVAKMLGDDPNTIREHYGDTRSNQVDASAAVLAVKS